jgi:endonuclease/exonuclease/phosphatase (EEP) superfamily protein YafD
MLARVVTIALVSLLSIVLLVFAWPQLFDLQAAPVIAQVVSLRGLDVTTALAAILILGMLAVNRHARRLACALAAPLVIFAIVVTAILCGRGFGGPVDASPLPPGAVTVMEWNTKGDATGAAAIAKVALTEHAEIVSLPGTTQDIGVQVALAMKVAGRPMWVYSTAFGHVARSKSTTLLISSSLGRYEVEGGVGNTVVQPTIVVKPVNGVGPTLVAVHAVSPRPSQMRNWRTDLKYLSTLCSGPTNGNGLIMTGDFNATLDNLQPLSSTSGADFGQCLDAALRTRGAAIGSWPTALPPLLGAQIDHVMTTVQWKTISMQVVTTEDHAGSDHRPIVATLIPTNQHGPRGKRPA